MVMLFILVAIAEALALVILLGGVSIPLAFKKCTNAQYIKIVVITACVSVTIAVIPVIVLLWYIYPPLHQLP